MEAVEKRAAIVGSFLDSEVVAVIIAGRTIAVPSAGTLLLDLAAERV
jgi:hypothetical protein